jgi:hypothetical protein
MIHESLQPLHDLFALVSGDIHSQDVHAPPDVPADLFGHFIIR